MNSKNILSACCGFFFLLTTQAIAADAKKNSEPSNPDSLVESFECRMIRDGKLAELKLKLIENCNLNKPFSFAATDYAIGGAYTICCHKR